MKAEDLSIVNRLLQSNPDLQDSISVIRQVNAKAKYPIASFEDLANALGGENATITFRGRTLTMAEVRSAIPAYYFPIASEADLTAKMADLAKALPQALVGAPVTMVTSTAQQRPRDESLTNPVVPATPALGRPGIAVLTLPK